QPVGVAQALPYRGRERVAVPLHQGCVAPRAIEVVRAALISMIGCIEQHRSCGYLHNEEAIRPGVHREGRRLSTPRCTWCTGFDAWPGTRGGTVAAVAGLFRRCVYGERWLRFEA